MILVDKIKKALGGGASQTNPDAMTPKEHISFGLSKFGYESLKTIVTNYLKLFYYAIGIKGDTVGKIVAGTKIWDSINDPLTATIIDNGKGKKGRFKPYLARFVPILAILSVFLFINPPTSSMRLKILFFVMIYVVWETTSTFSQVAFGAIGTVLSGDQNERSTYMTVGNIGATLAGALPGLIPLLYSPLVKESANDPNGTMSAAGFYTLLSVIFAVMGGVGAMFTVNLKERIKPIRSQKHILEGFVTMFKNKQFIILWLGNISEVVMSISSAVGSLVYIYSMGDFKYQTIYWIITSVPAFAFSLTTPYFMKRFRPSRIFIFAKFLYGISYLLIYFIVSKMGYTTTGGMIVFFGLAMIAYLPGKIADISGDICKVNTFDYVEYKTGQRAEATTMMISDMVKKWLQAGGELIGGFMLVRIGFQSGEGVIQTQATKDGLFMFYLVFQGIGYILSAIPYFFFKLEGEDFYEKMRIFKAKKDEEIAAREAAIVTAE